MIGSTFSNNEGDDGGAINNDPVGTLNMTGSTFSGNQALFGGGAISNFGSSTVINNTFADNSVLPGFGGAGGAIFNANETLAVINSTFADNSAPSGGAIDNSNAGNATIDNSLIVYGLSGEGCAGVVLGANNLEFPGPLATCGTNTIVTTSNPLGSNTLADNGGPTQTIALPAGSPAINAASNCPPVITDQRGVRRPQGAACDIGAFELQQQPSPPPPTPPPVVSPTPTPAPPMEHKKHKKKQHKKKGKGGGGISQR